MVGACLDNVARHVGADAPAWVLLEDLGDRVVVTVRDEGPGIPDGRLEEAEAQGRLGVSESIRGRIADLGGTADAAHRLVRHRVGAERPAPLRSRRDDPLRPPVPRPGVRPTRCGASAAGSAER